MSLLFFTLQWLPITLEIKSKFFTLAPQALRGLERALYSLYHCFSCSGAFAAALSGWNAFLPLAFLYGWFHSLILLWVTEFGAYVVGSSHCL